VGQSNTTISMLEDTKHLSVFNQTDEESITVKQSLGFCYFSISQEYTKTEPGGPGHPESKRWKRLILLVLHVSASVKGRTSVLLVYDTVACFCGVPCGHTDRPDISRRNDVSRCQTVLNDATIESHQFHIRVSFCAASDPGCRRGAVVSSIRRVNEVNPRRARLVLGWVTVFGRVYHLCM